MQHILLTYLLIGINSQRQPLTAWSTHLIVNVHRMYSSVSRGLQLHWWTVTLNKLQWIL